uniref:Ig-like domain-containing protein n=1 Tax=Labrus bergylta TaxID=56723 RepID=A0A3Q3EV16_9LABR
HAVVIDACSVWVCCFSPALREDRVIQPTEDVFASEGDTVKVDCTFETPRTSPTLFWYRQKCNDFPRYMLKSYSDNAEKAPEFQTDRFNAAINGTSVPLKIQKLQLTDSAVYYCALKPTVTGNTQLCTRTSGEKTTQYSTTSTRGSHTLINFNRRYGDVGSTVLCALKIN